jgi:histone-binding protein RBBP4
LYNTIITQSVLWPSLTAQWLPDKMTRSEGYSINKILYGTNTSNEEQDYLIVSKVKLT